MLLSCEAVRFTFYVILSSLGFMVTQFGDAMFRQLVIHVPTRGHYDDANVTRRLGNMSSNGGLGEDSLMHNHTTPRLTVTITHLTDTPQPAPGEVSAPPTDHVDGDGTATWVLTSTLSVITPRDPAGLACQTAHRTGRRAANTTDRELTPFASAASPPLAQCSSVQLPPAVLPSRDPIVWCGGGQTFSQDPLEAELRYLATWLLDDEARDTSVLIIGPGSGFQALYSLATGGEARNVYVIDPYAESLKVLHKSAALSQVDPQKLHLFHNIISEISGIVRLPYRRADDSSVFSIGHSNCDGGSRCFTDTIRTATMDTVAATAVFYETPHTFILRVSLANIHQARGLLAPHTWFWEHWCVTGVLMDWSGLGEADRGWVWQQLTGWGYYMEDVASGEEVDTDAWPGLVGWRLR